MHSFQNLIVLPGWFLPTFGHTFMGTSMEIMNHGFVYGFHLQTLIIIFRFSMDADQGSNLQHEWIHGLYKEHDGELFKARTFNPWIRLIEQVMKQGHPITPIKLLWRTQLCHPVWPMTGLVSSYYEKLSFVTQSGI